MLIPSRVPTIFGFLLTHLCTVRFAVTPWVGQMGAFFGCRTRQNPNRMTAPKRAQNGLTPFVKINDCF
jgi:hypothetical protein